MVAACWIWASIVLQVLQVEGVLGLFLVALAELLDLGPEVLLDVFEDGQLLPGRVPLGWVDARFRSLGAFGSRGDESRHVSSSARFFREATSSRSFFTTGSMAEFRATCLL